MENQTILSGAAGKMLEAWKSFWRNERRSAPTDTEFGVTPEVADVVRHEAAVWAKGEGR